VICHSFLLFKVSKSEFLTAAGLDSVTAAAFRAIDALRAFRASAAIDALGAVGAPPARAAVVDALGTVAVGTAAIGAAAV
jgi:hypothetical protein